MRRIAGSGWREGASNVIDDQPGKSAHSRSRHTDSDWREVADALKNLGEAIDRAGRTPVGEDEHRRRMRELSEGLASLAASIGASAEGPTVSERAARPVGMTAAPLSSAETPSESAAEPPPEVLNAIMAANEKFRQAAQRFEHPEAAACVTTPFPPLPTGTTVPAPVVPQPSAERVTTPSPAPSSAAPVAPAVSVTAQPAKVSSLDRLNAIRAAHERFATERRAAEEAAATASSFLPPEDTAPEPGKEEDLR